MEQYRVAFYFKWQLTVGIEYEVFAQALVLDILFVRIHFALNKEAYGIRFFKD